MNERLITWNFANWLTIALMVTVLYFVGVVAVKTIGAKFLPQKKAA